MNFETIFEVFEYNQNNSKMEKVKPGLLGQLRPMATVAACPRQPVAHEACQAESLGGLLGRPRWSPRAIGSRLTRVWHSCARARALGGRGGEPGIELMQEH
jgi:hypothetical protein